MKDFLLFRKMISPILIQIIFWIAVILFVYTAAVDFIYHVDLRIVFEVLILGPISARIVCELLLVWFRLYDATTAIREQLIKNPH